MKVTELWRIYTPPPLRFDFPCRRSVALALACAVLVFLSIAPLQAQVTNTIRSDATWRATSVSPVAGWNSSASFDDSDSAGWENAFKSPSGDNIWFRSNLSSQAPNQAWFRHVFWLDGPVTASRGLFGFDDNGEAYINGTLIVSDTGGGASSFDLQLDPGLFAHGYNLIAVHGIDAAGPYNNISVNMQITAVPEPSVLSLVVVAGLLFLGRKTWN